MRIVLTLIAAMLLGTSADGRAQTAVQRDSTGGKITSDTTALAPIAPPGVTIVPMASGDGMGFIFLTNDLVISDVTALVNVLLGKSDDPSPKYLLRADGKYAVKADANRDGQLSIADVTFMVNKILGK